MTAGKRLDRDGTSGEKYIRIEKEVDISTARIEAGKMAQEAGLGIVESHCVIISVSELAMNIYLYASTGTIGFRIVTIDNSVKGIEITARDSGPGIKDIDMAMTDGYSDSGGLGGGLPGVKRMMSEIYVKSELGKGTLVRAVKWSKQTSLHKVGFSFYKPTKEYVAIGKENNGGIL